MHQIDLEGAVRSMGVHIKGQRLDASGRAQFRGEEQLLGIGILVVTVRGNVAACGSTIAHSNIAANQTLCAEGRYRPITAFGVVAVCHHTDIILGSLVQTAQEIGGACDDAR